MYEYFKKDKELNRKMILQKNSIPYSSDLF